MVDAAGYRDRRSSAVESSPTGQPRRRRPDGPVALEPMTAVERKIVHLRLKDAGTTTTSEGTEPNRHVVVAPA